MRRATAVAGQRAGGYCRGALLRSVGISSPAFSQHRRLPACQLSHEAAGTACSSSVADGSGWQRLTVTAAGAGDVRSHGSWLAAGARIRVAGIETSCDDTAVGVVEAVLSPAEVAAAPDAAVAPAVSGGAGATTLPGDTTAAAVPLLSHVTTSAAAGASTLSAGRVLANVVGSQHSLHAAYGGVVPHIAAAAHEALLPRLWGMAQDAAATTAAAAGDASAAQAASRSGEFNDASSAPFAPAAGSSSHLPLTAIGVAVGPGLPVCLDAAITWVQGLAGLQPLHSRALPTAGGEAACAHKPADAAQQTAHGAGLQHALSSSFTGFSAAAGAPAASLMDQPQPQQPPSQSHSRDQPRTPLLSRPSRLPLVVPVHHLEAHLLLPRLFYGPAALPFPFLVLLVSGGHTSIAIAHGVGAYTLLGGTSDDALGECLDKVARTLRVWRYQGQPPPPQEEEEQEEDVSLGKQQRQPSLVRASVVPSEGTSSSPAASVWAQAMDAASLVDPAAVIRAASTDRKTGRRVHFRTIADKAGTAATGEAAAGKASAGEAAAGKASAGTTAAGTAAAGTAGACKTGAGNASGPAAAVVAAEADAAAEAEEAAGLAGMRGHLGAALELLAAEGRPGAIRFPVPLTGPGPARRAQQLRAALLSSAAAPAPASAGDPTAPPATPLPAAASPPALMPAGACVPAAAAAAPVVRFSFSGLKSAVLRFMTQQQAAQRTPLQQQAEPGEGRHPARRVGAASPILTAAQAAPSSLLSPPHSLARDRALAADVAAGVFVAACAHLRRQLLAALQHCDALADAGHLPHPITHVVVCGGVAANAIIRRSVQAAAAEWSEGRVKRGQQQQLVSGRGGGSTPQAAASAGLTAAPTRCGAGQLHELPEAQELALMSATPGSVAAAHEAVPPLPLPVPVTALFPPPALCTDNGVMVAWAAAEIIAAASAAVVSGPAAYGAESASARTVNAARDASGGSEMPSALPLLQPPGLRHRVIDPNTPEGLAALQQLRSQPRWPLGALR